MTSRTRFLITAAVACHLLLAPPLVTSQLLSPSAPASAQDRAATAGALKDEDVTITALQQEKVGPIYKLHGNAEIHYGTYVLLADEITYNSDTGDSTADGNVVLDGGPSDEHVRASHASYNLRSEVGRFETVTGSIGARLHGNRLMLTSTSPFFFTGKTVEKLGPDHYKVYDGAVTTCELPRPKWQFSARKVEVEVGGTAKIYHSRFGLGGIPVLYFPFATLPAQRLPRQSGFLIPNFGTSSTKGIIFGESIFWAINRSMDAHIGAEYFSKRGWAPQGEFRVRPSETSFVDLNYFSVLDRGVGSPRMNQGGEEARLTAEGEFGHNFRGVADVDYLSSFVFRLAFNEVFTQAVNSEVRSSAFLSNATRGYFYNATMHRYQDFEGTTSGDVITILHAPGFEVSSVDHQISSSPFYWSYNAAAEGLSRSEPGFSTAPLLGRFDFSPALSLPLQTHGWSFRPELSVRDTAYTQELLPSQTGVGEALANPINRRALEGSVEIRPPVLDRVFQRQFLGRKWKHVIEPKVVYDYVTGVHNFANILRFDERDILTGTNEVEYGVVQRLYAKRTSEQAPDCGQPGMPALFVGGAAPHNPIPWERQAVPTDPPCSQEPQVREVVTWELAQKYFIDPTFGGALVPGRSNVFTTTVDLTGVAFLSQARHLSPLTSRLRVQTSSRTDLEWDVDYDFKQGQMNASTALLNYRLGPFTLGGGDAFLRVPPETGVASSTPSPQSFNQFRLLLGYGHTNKTGFSAATNLGFDANLNFLQYAAVQTTYNWNCCGINLEFRRFALGSVRNENQYRFTFALANLGALGNLRRTERLF
ncbi:MAG: LPS assembly protein LptD [Terriglobales bacterium]